LDDGFERLFDAAELGRETAFVADGGAATFFFSTDLSA
jgi:hypothetical protein